MAILRSILPSINEQFQRIFLPFIVCSFLNINLDRYAFVCISFKV